MYYNISVKSMWYFDTQIKHGTLYILLKKIICSVPNMVRKVRELSLMAAICMTTDMRPNMAKNIRVNRDNVIVFRTLIQG